MDPGQSEEGPSLPKESDEEKASKEFNIPFKVVRITKTYELKMVKPVQQSGVDITYPTVRVKEETAGNEHAFHIMLNLNHKNILSMKVLCENKLQSNDAKSVAIFVEPYDGLLWSLCSANNCTDQINHLPSRKLQSYLRQIVMGLDFLRKNDLYHGNLGWNSTLYQGDTVKLAGFRSQESKSKDEAQWDDWLSFLGMLQTVLDQVTHENSLEAGRYFCGNLISLINMLKTLDRTSLPTIKNIVLEHIFFWDVARRLKFFSYTISLKLNDARFMERVRKSSIRGKSWDKDCRHDFRSLVKKMNDYREAEIKNSRKDQKGKSRNKDENEGAYDGDSLTDYVRLICGACTHWRQLQVDVDRFIRENHPAIHGDIKNILEASDDQDLPYHTNQSGGHGLQGYRPQGHGAAKPHSQNKPGIGYSPRGASPHQNYNPFHGALPGPSTGHMARQGPSQHPSYGSDYDRQGSQPNYSQPPSYLPGRRNYISYGQSQDLHMQHAMPLHNYGHGHGGPVFYAPLPSQYYGQPPMGPQGGYPQQQDLYARPPYSGPGQWGAPASYASYLAPPPASYGPQFQQPYAYYETGYTQQVGQAPYPPAALGYPQQYPNSTSAYQHSGYGPTAPAAGQAGYASAPAVSQPPYGQAGTQPSTNRPSQGQSAAAPAQSGYTAPAANPS